MRVFEAKLVSRLLKCSIACIAPRRRLGRKAVLWLAVAGALLAAGGPVALGQQTAAEEANRRRAVLDRLPRDAAQLLFGLADSPAPGPARAIGVYSKGCLAGGTELPADGPNWQVMRPSRNRAWGHPLLISFLQRLAVAGAAAGWPGLLVGDMAQPRGGPMLTGHASHQLGIEADIWLKPMPEQRLSSAERDEISATNVVADNLDDIDPATWLPEHKKLLETGAKSPGVARIFVNPAIKRALCREAGSDRGWLRRIRPSQGHNYHFHVRLACPAGDEACHNQPDPPPGDGCGADLDWWFTPEARRQKPPVPAKPLRLSDLPPACAALVNGR
jgi:penicillin-insensitive murein DD-endopeptidase